MLGSGGDLIDSSDPLFEPSSKSIKPKKEEVDLKIKSNRWVTDGGQMVIVLNP
jgi:hypothetical protein